jgi:hypothetical protein
MTANLTLAQTIAVATRTAIPPLQATRLRKAGETGSLSLRTVRDQVQARHTIFVVQVRDTSILKASSSFADLVKNWQLLDTAFVPSRTKTAKLIKVLNAAGVTVAALSKDWRTMWLSGTAGAFCSVKCVVSGNAIDHVPQPEQTAPNGVVEQLISTGVEQLKGKRTNSRTRSATAGKASIFEALKAFLDPDNSTAVWRQDVIYR